MQNVETVPSTGPRHWQGNVGSRRSQSTRECDVDEKSRDTTADENATPAHGDTPVSQGRSIAVRQLWDDEALARSKESLKVEYPTPKLHLEEPFLDAGKDELLDNPRKDGSSEKEGGAVHGSKKSRADAPPLLQIGDVLLKTWVITEKLGGGAFGEAYIAVTQQSPSEVGKSPHVRIGGEVCIKVERPGRQSVLKSEAMMLRLAQRCVRVVRFVARGRHDNLQYLVMERLGENVAALRRRYTHGHFDFYTATMLALSALEVLESIHEVGIVHRDVKPSNFVIGMNENARHLFLVDFGLAKRFLTSDGTIRPPRPDAGFRGTARYASLNSHRHIELGPVDDLWSWFFMYVEFVTGSLPWRKAKDKETIGKLKASMVGPVLVGSLPVPFRSMMEHLQTLHYESKPNYAYLTSLLWEMLSRRNYPPNRLLPWEAGQEKAEVRSEMHASAEVSSPRHIETPQPAESSDKQKTPKDDESPCAPILPLAVEDIRAPPLRLVHKPTPERATPPKEKIGDADSAAAQHDGALVPLSGDLPTKKQLKRNEGHSLTFSKLDAHPAKSQEPQRYNTNALQLPEGSETLGESERKYSVPDGEDFVGSGSEGKRNRLRDGLRGKIAVAASSDHLEIVAGTSTGERRRCSSIAHPNIVSQTPLELSHAAHLRNAGKKRRHASPQRDELSNENADADVPKFKSPGKPQKSDCTSNPHPPSKADRHPKALNVGPSSAPGRNAENNKGDSSNEDQEESETTTCSCSHSGESTPRDESPDVDAGHPDDCNPKEKRTTKCKKRHRCEKHRRTSAECCCCVS